MVCMMVLFCLYKLFPIFASRGQHISICSVFDISEALGQDSREWTDVSSTLRLSVSELRSGTPPH